MKKWILWVAAFCATVSAYAQQIKVDVQNLVGLDETFNVSFSIEGTANISDFQWSVGDDFQIVWGPSTSMSQNYRNINGKTSITVQKSWTYVLKPLKTGTFQLNAASAKLDGTPIHSAIVSIQVIANGQQGSSGGSSSSGAAASTPRQQNRGTGDVSSEDIFLRLQVGKRSAVVGEPIQVSLKLYTRVQITGFDDLKLPVFNGFWSQELDKISQLSFERENYNDRIYNSAVIRNYVIIPQQAGSLTIDPAELVCLVAVHGSSSGNSIFDSLFDDYTQVRRRLTTSPVRIAVSSLPSGAPASFNGAVGQYKMTASLSRDEIKTDDAATLKITLSGTGNLSLLDAPQLHFPPDFEAYDPEVTSNTRAGGTSGEKVFEVPFIARTEGEYQIDPLEFSFYNTATQRYETLRSQALPIRVLPGEAAPLSGNSDTRPSVLPSQTEVKSIGDDIHFIVTTSPHLRPAGKSLVSSVAYWALLLLLLLAAGLFLLVRRILLSSRSDVVKTKSRRATKMALKRLSTAKAYLKEGNRTDFYAELHKALNGFAADKLSLDMTDMSKENIAQQLEQRGVDTEVVKTYMDLLDACEFARYAPSEDAGSMKRHYDDAVRVISSIASGIRKRTSALLSLLLPLLLLTGLPLSAQDVWTGGCQAYQEGRYEDALTQWTALTASGQESAELYYNIGNAQWRLGNKGQAILAYERALKRDPSFSDARDNLAYARQRISDSFAEPTEFFLLTSLRRFCYALRGDIWAIVAAILFALSLFLGVLYWVSDRRAWKIFGFFAAGVCFLFFALTLSFAIWQHCNNQRQEYGIVTTPVIQVKSAPAADSQDLFLIHEGTKLRYSGETVEAWTSVSVPDGRKGWIRLTDAEKI